MPHVELVGRLDLEEFHRRFRPRTIPAEECLIKADGCFLSHDHRTALVECLVIEGYLKQGFFVLLTAGPERVMVRLLPRTSPEKTDGVKRCVAGIALWLREISPESNVAATNLGPYLGPSANDNQAS